MAAKQETLEALKAPQKPLPFHFQFAAGAVAGVSEILVMYPLDVVKTRFQLQVKGAADNYTSIADCFRKIIKNEGFSKLYRGILPPIFVEAPKRAIKFAAFEQFSVVYKKLFNVDKLNQPMSILTGASAGASEALIVVSFDLVKIRLQDKNSAGKYSGTLDCIKKILRDEGPLAFFKGLESTIYRHAFWSGGYFGVIHGVRAALPEAETKQGELARNFVAGAIGGTFGTAINTPFDVVKTRIQNESATGVRKYNWAIPALHTVYKEEGFAALYKGFVPKVLRLGPGGGILLVVFDTVSNYLRKHYMD